MTTTAPLSPHHTAQTAPAPAKRRAAVFAALSALLLLALLCSVIIGTRPLAPATFWDYLSNKDISAIESAIIDQRLIRTLWAVLIGGSLALAGAGMQGITRNPLGDPGILGVNAGASLAVVLGISMFSVASPTGFALLALVGAGTASLLVYLLAAVGKDGATPVKLALMGAALSAGLGSITSALILTHDNALDNLRKWQIGTISGSSIDELFPGLYLMLAGALILLSGARTINNFALGDDMAASLGENVAFKRFWIFTGVTLLSGSATAMAGPIGFIGLMAAHALRPLIGADYRYLLPATALCGALLLTFADTIGRIIMPPEEVQVGVSMVLLGVPVFLYIVRKNRAVSLT